jgi:D-glycero-D-manno-heptose 1,7-bisphosphate phosphatase
MSGVPAVFLDRDGVLNRSFDEDGTPVPPRRLADFELLPGVSAACHRLSEAGLLLVVVTNQPDVSRGTLARSDLDAIHDRLRELLPVDDVRVCTHDDQDDCACRKPRPGMILDAAAELGIDLARSVLVGDRWRDIEAARNARVRSVLIAPTGHADGRSDPDFTFPSLADAVEPIVAMTES